MSAAWGRLSKEQDEDEEGNKDGRGKVRIDRVVRGSAERYAHAKVGGRCVGGRRAGYVFYSLSLPPVCLDLLFGVNSCRFRLLVSTRKAFVTETSRVSRG